ncbi:MAG: hypothetical protein ACUVUF_08645 [Candidatus Bathycorpusculaceae bacterium]
MPHIKKIELTSFKSFGPKTVKLVLDKGFTAITGPEWKRENNFHAYLHDSVRIYRKNLKLLKAFGSGLRAYHYFYFCKF